MSGVLRWEVPAAESPRRGRAAPVADWWRIAAQLRDRPREWAVISETSSPQAATYIRQGHYPAFTPAGSFEAVGRRVNGVYTLYARYVGGGAS